MVAEINLKILPEADLDVLLDNIKKEKDNRKLKCTPVKQKVIKWESITNYTDYNIKEAMSERWFKPNHEAFYKTVMETIYGKDVFKRIEAFHMSKNGGEE